MNNTVSIYEYESEKWRQHQSKFTKFLNLLNKNKNNISRTELYTCKLLELNELLAQIETTIDDITYECIYTNTRYRNNKKVKSQVNQHLKMKDTIKKMVLLSTLVE